VTLLKKKKRKKEKEKKKIIERKASVYKKGNCHRCVLFTLIK
jgi:hypothetical protein